MKQLSEFDKVHTPQDWIEDAIKLQEKVQNTNTQNINTQKMNVQNINTQNISVENAGSENQIIENGNADNQKIKNVSLENKGIKKQNVKNVALHFVKSRNAKIIVAAALVFILIGVGTFPYVARALGMFEMTDKEIAINQEPFVMLLSGSDSYEELSGNGRSDANLLAAVNPATKRIAVIAFDRDAYVDVPQEAIEAATGKYAETSGFAEKFKYINVKDKITNIHTLGEESYKIAIENAYDVKVDYSSIVNFEGIQKMIDTIGGIDVELEEGFVTTPDTAPVEYTFTEGINHCDGAQALALCRERKAFSDGNTMRMKNQISVMKAVINKVMSPDVLYAFDDVISIVSDMLLTDMTNETVIALMKGQINSLADWQLDTYVIGVSGHAGSDSGLFGYPGIAVTLQSEDSVREADALIKEVLEK